MKGHSANNNLLSQNPSISIGIKVVDDDTIDAKIDNGMKRVRLLGVNTPKSAASGQSIEFFGKEAASKNQRKISG